MVCFENDSVYKLGASFTMRNILSIIDKMSVAIPHHEFEAEPIGEGGIRMKGYTAGAPFKTIRFNFDNWPWCPDGVENEDLDRRLIVNDFTGKKRLYSNLGLCMVHLNGRKMKLSVSIGFSVKRG